MTIERIEIEAIMAEIRGTGREVPRSLRDDPVVAAPAVERALELRRTLAELTDCCDLYAARGMPPTRFWIPRPVRWFLVRAIRYFLNWQTHWNLTAVRALDEMVRTLQRLERSAQTKSAQIEERLARSDATREAAAARRRIADRSYLAFEARHRGSEAEVRDRLASHVPVFTAAYTDEDPRSGEPVLDLACGRGEMLELLREARIIARGIDRNAEMIDTCRAKQLDVVEADVFDYLERLTPDSVRGVVCCQFVEHLSFDDILRLFALVTRVLRAGSPCVFETVNPENLVVSAYSFHVDPTHRTKLPPPTLTHLAESFGLEVLEVRHSSRASEEQQLKLVAGDDPPIRVLNENLRRLNELLFGPRDYAIVCRKPRIAQGERPGHS